jgi:putative restriction endonuclease
VSQRKDWTRDDLMVALNLYCKLTFGRLNDTTPEIVTLARLMGRTPGSLTMKLCNFASLDPGLQARGIKGLRGSSRADRRMWAEFQADWNGMGLESEKLYQDLVGAIDPLADEGVTARGRKTRKAIVMPKGPPVGETEVETSVTARRGQSFFRKAVLASYGCKCCVTGNPIPELLVASHILPWGKYPKHRLNPQNGLCLAKTQDAAFDARLITFDKDGCMMVSKYIEDFLPSEAIEREFIAFRGKRIAVPDKFPPDPALLAIHRDDLFVGRTI